MESVLDGKAKMGTIGLIEKTAQVISDTADCAIGYGAADYILKSLKAFRGDYEYHIQKGKCSAHFEQAVPCISKCPANVEVPSYLSLVGEKRYTDAIRIIRKDNPSVRVRLRLRAPVRDALPPQSHRRCHNIRGIKRFAADNSGLVPPRLVCRKPERTSPLSAADQPDYLPLISCS
jgi:hypothetical protein